MGRVNRKVVLITGASSGIGKALANILMEKGYKVYGTSRKQPTGNGGGNTLQPDANGGFIKMIQLDVCSGDSVKEAVEFIVEQEGCIDVLINNAGFGIAGSVEDTSEEEAYQQFNTNFFGVHRMCRQVLPIMREQGSGLIVNVSSVAGLISIPFQSMYSASKYALEALSEAMRIEVKPFGVNVVLVEPGDTKTGFTDSRQFVNAGSDSVYSKKFKKSINTMIKDEVNGPSPESVAKVIARVVEMKNPPVRVVAGLQYKVFVFLKRLLPSRFVEYVISKLY
jgi:short-subunit dehydrogenase